LQSWFIQYGHTRNNKDEQNVKQYMQNHLPENAWQQNGFYERIYLYQSFCTYAYIRQDFVSYYKYAQKWANLFEESPMMLRVETSHYIKAMHSLLNAHFVLRNFQQFDIVLARFIIFSETDRVKLHDNFRTQAFISIYSAKINQHNMLGTFKEGIKIVPFVLEQIKANELFIDEYRVMVFNYKIASLYFGNGNYDKCIDFLQKIIQQTGDERNDLQGYARILHLIAHYELGNFELMEYLTKSVFRFLSKKEYLTEIEKEMFKYLRNSFSISRKELLVALNELLVKIKKLEKNAFETRVFTYLDLVSWIESKVYNKTMESILQEKNKQRKIRNYT
jgi:tetratricopeptide (TPR) repeat protein